MIGLNFRVSQQNSEICDGRYAPKIDVLLISTRSKDKNDRILRNGAQIQVHKMVHAKNQIFSTVSTQKILITTTLEQK